MTEIRPTWLFNDAHPGPDTLVAIGLGYDRYAPHPATQAELEDLGFVDGQPTRNLRATRLG